MMDPMDCPIDGTTLQMTDRQGIEIDYCPQCRGVWLDRGELDKIIERSATWDAERGRDRDDDRRDERRRYDDDDDDRRAFGRKDKPPKKKESKTKSFFETIMESVGEG
jgi:uncharacterized protein